MSRPICLIASEIFKEWSNPHYTALPYLNAMLHLDSIKDKYGADDGEYVVLYFLVNASTFRGEAARRLKAELRALL